MAEIDLTTSRRALLGSLAATSIVAVQSLASPWDAATAMVPREAPVILRRSREGRSASRFRYHNAERFFASVECEIWPDRSDELYRIGIVVQLALSSHLLDVGFVDKWCARHLALDLAKSLKCANATGLGHDCPELADLAARLSPYGQFRNPDSRMRCNCPFSTVETLRLTRALLDRVRDVTGHPRPRGWSGSLS
ncbi:hypothetical protein U1839_13510 [Sphingomonas sp. RT2P30]|uniref:hypothetical protein n=1 Tax=Parasphingomonas halimpatiens TaxID=3096162 RepID=UPI002FCBE7EA